MPRKIEYPTKIILGAKRPDRTAHDKWRFEHTLTRTASDIVNGLINRYYDSEFDKHENILRGFWREARHDNPKLGLACALVDCVLDGFNEVRYGRSPTITYPIGLDDILETIDEQKIEASRGLDAHTLQVARNICSYYITAYMDLPTEKKEPEDRKHGDFLIACSTLKMLNEFRPVIPED
jgi:hypothetical protein